MRRESVYVCTYVSGEDEHVAYVCAWDDHEAAELIAHEIELESTGPEVHVTDIRVRPVHGGDRAAGSVAS